MVHATVGDMNTKSIADVAEQIVLDTVSAMTMPHAGECLACYVDRQLSSFGCDGTHRFAQKFRDTTAPRATALEYRLADMGACCCDCEIFLNAYRPTYQVWIAYRSVVLRAGRGGSTANLPDVDEAQDWETGPRPPCLGVRRGSTQPCAVWERNRREW